MIRARVIRPPGLRGSRIRKSEVGNPGGRISKLETDPYSISAWVGVRQIVAAEKPCLQLWPSGTVRVASDQWEFVAGADIVSLVISGNSYEIAGNLVLNSYEHTVLTHIASFGSYDVACASLPMPMT